MKSILYRLIWTSFPAFLLSACGSEPPSFIEKPTGIVSMVLDDNASAASYSGDDQFDMDELLAADENEWSADAVGATGKSKSIVAMANSGAGDEVESSDSSDSSNAPANDKNDNKNNGKGKNQDQTSSADASMATDTSADEESNHSQASQTQSTTPSIDSPTAPSDNKAVAKACAPLFQGTSQKILIIDGNNIPSSLKIPANTVIAFKVNGNRSKLQLDLPQGYNLPGICFFVSGHESEVKFTSASFIQSFAYVASGDLSTGQVTFSAGSPEKTSIALKGNKASLTVKGLSQNLCQEASLKGNAPNLQCSPL